MRTQLRVAVATVAALLCAACGEPGPSPNVLVYVIDTLRADGVGYESEAAWTPHLDRFAAEAVIFEQARAPSSWTRPSFASILTGTHPASHGVYGRGSMLRDDARTLPELLREAGYATGFITANPNVGSFFGFDQGFDDVLQLYGRRLAGPVDEKELITRADEVTTRALEWIATAPRPFLLVLLTVDPHLPYGPPGELRQRALARLEAAQLPDLAAAGTVRPRRFRREVRAAYQGEISFNDGAFGTLADSLRAQGILDDTLVVVTSDHGEEFWEHGGTMHGKTLFDEVLRVPLLVRFPRGAGPPRGKRVAAPVRSIDILPTVLESLELPAPDDLAGRSLLRAGEGPDPDTFASLYLAGRDLHTLTVPPWKLHVDRITGEETLFDLERDPYERSPVDVGADARASEAFERLRHQLAEITRRAPDRASVGSQDLVIPEDARATLEALGYLEEEPTPPSP